MSDDETRAQREPSEANRTRRVPAPPEPTLRERLLDTVRSVVLGSGPIADFLGSYFPAIRERRADNEEFHDMVCATTDAAMRTHLETKRAALRNALVNSQLPGAPDAIKQHMFVQLVDEFSELHLAMLDLADGPGAWFERNGMQLPEHYGETGMGFSASSSDARLENVLRVAFRSRDYDSDLLKLVLEELNRRGLVREQSARGDRPLTMETYCHDSSVFTTLLGMEFVSFIREPSGSDVEGASEA